MTFIWLVSLSACSGSKPLALDHHTFITFGSLGGFAGTYKEFRLMPDGSLFKKSKYQGGFEVMESLSKEEVEHIFDIIHEVNDLSLSTNDPGNLTSFLSYTKNGTVLFECIWGGGNEEPHDQLLKSYVLLNKLCRDSFPVR